MAMGSPEWIEESLVRLESMEQERDEHERALESTADADALRMHSESIDRLDEEIKQLYAALEAVAEDSDEEEEDEDDVDDVIRTSPFERDDEAPAAAPEPEPEPEPAPVAAPVDDLPDDPFGAPAPVASAPAAAVAAAPAFADPAPMTMDAGFDEPKSGGAGKWVVLVVLLVGGGAGGFFFWKNQQKPPPAPVAPTEAKVIEATAVPEDTQGPKGAQGQEGVTKTPDRDLSKSGRRGGGGGGNRGGGGGGKKKSDGKAIELKAGDDPLG